MRGLGFRVWAVGGRVWSARFGVEGLECEASGSGRMMWGRRLQDLGSRL